MKKYGIFTAFIVFVLVLCLPVLSFAAGELTPIRARFYGALAQGENSQWVNLRCYTDQNNRFVLMSDVNGFGVAYITLFFDLGVSHVDSFSLRIKKDNTLLDGAAALSGQAVNLMDSNFSNSVSIRTQCQISRTTEGDDTFYNWSLYSSSGYDRNVLSVTINYAATVIGQNSPIGFIVDNLTVNGMAVEEIAVTETNEGFAEQISDLAENENEWWLRVVAPDYEQFLDDPYIYQESADYRLAIKAISYDNFLVPGMITIVFIMAFYGFVLYGKKG